MRRIYEIWTGYSTKDKILMVCIVFLIFPLLARVIMGIILIPFALLQQTLKHSTLLWGRAQGIYGFVAILLGLYGSFVICKKIWPKK